MIQRPDAELDPWRGLPTATVSDAMGRVGAMDAGISRLSGISLGRAYPVSTAAGDNSTIHRALNAGPHKGFVGSYGDRAQCEGVSVARGDLILGDADGISVVPASEMEDLLPRVREKIATEEQWMRLIEEGRSTVDILNIGVEHVSRAECRSALRDPRTRGSGQSGYAVLGWEHEQSSGGVVPRYAAAR